METPQPKPDARAFARLLALAGALGVAVALVYLGFEYSMEHARHWLWHTLPGGSPSWWQSVAIAAVGALLLGLALRFLPGHGGPHPADSHGPLAASDPAQARPRVVASVLVVGFIGLSFGASLGPEGALLPAIGLMSMLAARAAGVEGRASELIRGAGLGALIAAMFGSPLAGVVPLLELVPVQPGAAMAMLVLPALTASSTAALTLQMLSVHATGALPFTYDHFRPVHLVWAVLIGVLAGFAGLQLERLVRLLRPATLRIEQRSVVLVSVIGGVVLGLLYALGGESVRFSGIPELLHAVSDTNSAWRALLLSAIKLLATAWCLAVGYRGGKIFPAAFIGGTAGLALHLAIPAIPVEVAWGVGMAGSIATALGTPVLAVLIVASIESPAMLPLAVIGVVAAHTVHLLGDQLRALDGKAAA